MTKILLSSLYTSEFLVHITNMETSSLNLYTYFRREGNKQRLITTLEHLQFDVLCKKMLLATFSANMMLIKYFCVEGMDLTSAANTTS